MSDENIDRKIENIVRTIEERKQHEEKEKLTEETREKIIKSKFNLGTIIPPEEINDDDEHFYSKFRGDYLDLRDFLNKETIEEKVKFIINIAKGRVLLVREHLLLIWTFNDEWRDDLTEELLILNEIIYNDKNNLDV